MGSGREMGPGIRWNWWPRRRVGSPWSHRLSRTRARSPRGVRAVSRRTQDERYARPDQDRDPLERLGGREVKTLGKFRGGGVESSVRFTSADIGLTSHFRGGGPARERSGTSAQRTAAVGLTTAGPWLSSL